MKLFEIITSYTGESYVRSYCWAASEQRARELFASVGDNYDVVEVNELMAADSLEFCTQPSDSGWRR